MVRKSLFIRLKTAIISASCLFFPKLSNIEQKFFLDCAMLESFHLDSISVCASTQSSKEKIMSNLEREKLAVLPLEITQRQIVIRFSLPGVSTRGNS